MEGKIANGVFSRSTFNVAGQDSFTSPPAQHPDSFSQLINTMPVTRGVLERRWGYSVFTASSGNYLTTYRNDTSNVRKLVLTTASLVKILNEDGTVANASLYVPGGGAAPPRLINSRDYGYFYDKTSGGLQKWDGATTLTKWGITAPTAALSVSIVGGAGNITLSQGRQYFVVYRNSTTNHRSDINAVSASSGPITAQNILVSSIPVSGDAQVDYKDILATLDGGDQTALYYLASVTNATVSLTDGTTEADLSASNVYASIDDSGNQHGVFDNAPPPNCTSFIKHRGRIYGIFNQYLYFSKSIDDVTTATGDVVAKYEEAWPPTYFMEVSTGAEVLKGLLSDGRSLYIGTERQIHRLSGDGPDNFDIPDIMFGEVGIYNQDVWQVTFLEGQPTGSVWLTPDLRVIGSDFNTYQDIGTPIQDVLSTINTSSTVPPSATFFAAAQYDLYILAIPTKTSNVLDTFCVYDMRRRVWVVWKPNLGMKFLAYNITQLGIPQLLALGSDTNTYIFKSTNSTDNGTPIPSIIQTAWIDFSDSDLFKLLNEIEVTTSDSGMFITVDSASSSAEFTNPRNVVTNSDLTTGPFGTFKRYLAGLQTKGKWYRFTFKSAGPSSPVLQAYRVVVHGVNRF
jgi:hypothetical protein